jgi:hypothetical protein
MIFTAVLAALLLLQDPQGVVIEMSKPQKGGGGLGTAGYGATAKEEPFLDKVTEKRVSFRSAVKLPKPSNMTDEEWEKFQKEGEKQREQEKAKRIPVETYQLADQANEYVGWFGIVRDSSADEKTGVTTLTLEHKYFDGMVDLHQQIVSINGAGDYTATLSKASTALPKLSLVRIYGKVVKGADGKATIAAEYVRVWEWGLFAFMDYGKDKSNPKWVALRKVPGNKSYTSRPSSSYYESLLGARE